MKIAAFISNIVISYLILVFLVIEYIANLFNSEVVLFSVNVLSVVGISLICIINLLVKILKKSKTLKQDILTIAAIVGIFVSRYILVPNFVMGIIFLILSQITLIIGMLISSKLRKEELVYTLVLFIPIFLMIIIAPLFGLGNSASKILLIILFMVLSYSLVKSIAVFSKKQSSSNILLCIGNIFFFIFTIVLSLVKFSNVAVILDYITFGALMVSLTLYALSVLLNDNIMAEEEQKKESVAGCVKKSIFTVLCSALACYSLVVSSGMFTLATAKVSKEQFLALMGDDFNLPIIEIDIEGNAMPISKQDYVNCSFKLYNTGNEEYNFEVEMADNYGGENSVGIRLRGNSTRRGRKRPYRIKFDEKKSILGLQKNKSWVLLADYFDQSHVKNYATFVLADSFDNLGFTPTGNHVALIINGEFKGLYLLCEQVDENKGRTNVKEDFDVTADDEYPFLIEMDELAWQEGETGVDNFLVKDINKYVEIKYPESDERQRTESSDKVYDYIYEYVNAVFTTLKTKQPVTVSFRDNPAILEDLVDIDSAVDYYLINEIMLNYDNAKKSIYLNKTKDGKMKFGPIWDFDQGMQNAYESTLSKSYIETARTMHLAVHSPIYSLLLQDETFYNKVAIRYNELNESLVNVSDYLRDYKQVIDKIGVLDANMWYGTTGEFEFDMQYDYVRLFFNDRYDYLNEVFSKTHSEFVGEFLR